MTSATPAARGALVLGMPRSGTTLLRRLLGAHPRILCPPETGLFGALGRVLDEQHFAGGMTLGVVSGLAYAGYAEPRFVDRLREFAFGVLDDLACEADKPTWVEKTAADVFHLDAIERLLGDHCRYVCLVRHPLDVIRSNRDLADRIQGYLPELHEFVRHYPMPYMAFAHAWRTANEGLLGMLERRPHAALMLRYEELVRNPQPALSRLFEFLGQPADVDRILETAFRNDGMHGLGDWKTYESTGLRADSIGRHGDLGSWTIREIAKVVNPLMPRLGYEPVECIEADDEAAERRRAELARLVISMKLREGRGER